MQDRNHLLLPVNSYMKKGQIWTSAVLYIVIGVITISIILSAGVPLVNKLKDKNTIIQTKELMLDLDKVIREVRNEGPGSKRVIQPFVIKDGNFFINTTNNENKIQWILKTSAVFVEPCGKTKADCLSNNLIIKEGPLSIYETDTIVEDEYIINLELDYAGVGFLKMKEGLGKDAPLLGRFSFIIENSGADITRSPPTNLPDLDITVN